jgi:hypothetical protein
MVEVVEIGRVGASVRVRWRAATGKPQDGATKGEREGTMDKTASVQCELLQNISAVKPVVKHDGWLC